MKSWPLKWTIPAIALVLVLLTEFLIGAAVLVLLQRTLTAQLDAKLEATASALVARPGALATLTKNDDGGEELLQAPNDVIVAVYRADGSEARAATRRLSSGRPRPPIDIVANAQAPYTARAQGEPWRVVSRTIAGGAADGTTIVVMAPLRDVGSVSTTLGRGIVLLGLAVAVLAAALAALATRRSLRPLADAERTAAAIAAGDLTRRVADYPEGTEAGSLAASLNVMLDRLSSSMAERDATEAKLRRFVSDASHELRTPLAAIRGYAELHRMGADGAGEALGRIEANADRMTALVDDLLLLARSDEASAVLGGDDQVDLAHILEETAADIRVQDPSRTVTVSIETAGVVCGSRRHLSQLFANLAGNVLHHTPSGSAVELILTADGESVVATMRDHGPGFGADHAGRAFERFYRADASRTRETGGSGLGLAIVAAIASAHGGTATAADGASSPSGAPTGAVVTVTFPLTRAPMPQDPHLKA